MRKTILMLVSAAMTLAGSLSVHAGGVSFTAILSGAEEVPANASNARGIAQFSLADDGMTVHYTLIVANLHNPVGAHIHAGTAGVNGPVIVPLFGGPVGTGRTSGILAEGSFVADPGLLLDMAVGNTYVNVHTNDGIDPPNTGPGDLPPGEIRGQVFAVSDSGS